MGTNRTHASVHVARVESTWMGAGSNVDAKEKGKTSTCAQLYGLNHIHMHKAAPKP